MADAKKIDFNEPAPLTDEEDDATLAAIDRGIKDADEGRTVALEEVRKMIPEWISKFESRKKR
jgi:predicted transcriptional regulator